MVSADILLLLSGVHCYDVLRAHDVACEMFVCVSGISRILLLLFGFGSSHVNKVCVVFEAYASGGDRVQVRCFSCYVHECLHSPHAM